MILLAILVVGCAGLGPGDVGPIPDFTPIPTEHFEVTTDEIESGTRRNKRVADDNRYPIGRNLPFDAIPPIYNPEFVPADQSPLNDDELILGVAWEGEAKAYPISVLRIREMVNDELAGIPTLVTW